MSRSRETTSRAKGSEEEGSMEIDSGKQQDGRGRMVGLITDHFKTAGEKQRWGGKAPQKQKTGRKKDSSLL